MVNRVLKYGLVAVVCALPALLETTPAQAISWGKKGRSGKVCRVIVLPHLHIGLGGDRATKRAAKSSAVQRWRKFSAWEYGREWSNVRLARHKSFSCFKAFGRWRCIYLAQPCRN